MASDATSFLLRFRDLVTGPSETIGRHDEIAKKEGSVWWGWWKKSGERPPVHEFNRLLKEGPLKILLVDSGQSRIYRAECEAVTTDLANPIASPENAKTPAYYRDQKYYAWYRLRGFELIPSGDEASVLGALSYAQVDEFFENEASPFKTFYGKRIHGVRELIQQNRTVWFSRPHREADPTHEISLLDTERVRPHLFAPTYFPASSRTILWVSDLHFAIGEAGHHGFPDQAGDQEANLWLALENALKQQGVESLAGVIASGDITWRADPLEFEKARGLFFDRLMSSYSLDPRQIVVCPGNHDIAFSDQPGEKHVPVRRAAKDSEAAFRTFYQGLFRIAPNEFLSSGRRVLVGEALPVDVVSLNSSLLQQHPDFTADANSLSPVFQGQGFVGVNQLEDAARQMRWDGESYSPVRALRIVMLHHHVLPVAEAERAVAGGNYSMVLDAERLSRWLVRHRVDVVLHGHQHQPFSVAITRTELLDHKPPERHTFRVLGMGSTGVAAKHLGAIAKNTFGLLRFGPDGIDVDYYSLHAANRSERLFTERIPYALRRGLPA